MNQIFKKGNIMNICPVTQSLNNHMAWEYAQNTYECGHHSDVGGCHECGLCFNCQIKVNKHDRCDECSQYE